MRKTRLFTTSRSKALKKTKPSYIKKILVSKAGEVLDSLKLKNDIARLRRQPAISHAYFQVFYSHENLYNVFIHIEENFTIIPFANFYTSNDGEFAYRVGVNEFNFLGHGINVGGFFQRDIYNSHAINFRAPFLFSRKLGLAFNYQSLTTLEPVFLTIPRQIISTTIHPTNFWDCISSIFIIDSN